MKLYVFMAILAACSTSQPTRIKLSEIYSKDSTNVYIKTVDVGGIIENADPKTFELLNPTDESSYTRDKSHVFFFGTKVKGADPAHFNALNERYGKDKNKAYLMEHPLEGVDLETFEALSENVWIAKDKNRVYYYGKIFEKADVKTFKLAPDLSCGKNCVYRYEDKNYYYGWDTKVVKKKN